VTEAAAVTLSVDEGDDRPVVLWIDNGLLRLGFVPAAGGRLLSVRLRGQETLWRDRDLLDDALHPRDGHTVRAHGGDMSAWVNYGGDKTGPAPQGWSDSTEWAGPPDPVLDSGAYAWSTSTTADGSLSLALESAPDPRSGLVIRRQFTLRPGESAYDVSLTATNSSAATVRWSLWNVTQRAADAPGAGGVWIATEHGRSTDPVPLAIGTAAPRYSRGGEDVVHLPHQDVVGKLGLPDADGWLAHVSGGTATTQSFTAARGAEYPDGGSRVEVWMEHPISTPLAHLGGLQPRHRIVEIEVLGPLATLEPGASTHFDFRCGLSTGRDAVATVAPAGHWGPAAVHADGSRHATFHPYRSGVLARAGGQPLAAVAAGTGIEIDVTDLSPSERLTVAGLDAGAVSTDLQEGQA
jgi:hypothetical protein